MKKLFIVLFVIVSSPLFAGRLPAIQEPDVIIFEGEELPLEVYPLESYKWLDTKKPFFRFVSSINTRMYEAHWIIESDKLFLAGIKGNIQANPKKYKNLQEMRNDKDYYPAKIKDLFPKKYKDGRVFADWFTGKLRIGKGGVVWGNPLGGRETFYSTEIFIEIENGIVVNTIVKDRVKRSQ